MALYIAIPKYYLDKYLSSIQYPLNLMLFTGLPAAGWEAYYYTTIEEIASPQKALCKWLNGTLEKCTHE